LDCDFEDYHLPLKKKNLAKEEKINIAKMEFLYLKKKKMWSTALHRPRTSEMRYMKK
jgi:hypothetical protein